MTNDWKDIHEDFGKISPHTCPQVYQDEWIAEGLTYQDAQEWIAVGFEPEDSGKVKIWKNHEIDPSAAKPWVEMGIKERNIVGEWEKFNFTPRQAKSWLNVGLNKKDAELAAYLRGKGYQPSSDLNLEQLRKEFITWKKVEKPAQEYLDGFYPKNQREEITWLDVRSGGLLEGHLDLSDFVNLEGLNCSSNKITSLNLNNCSKLKHLFCWENKLINLDLSDCSSLVEIDCHNNKLAKFILPQDCSNLKVLDLNENDFHQDLSFLSGAVNLREAWLQNNKFYGSLEFLKKTEKLKVLNVSNTDIDSGVEYLPDSLETFYCSANEREDAKVKIIEKELREYGEPEYADFIDLLTTWKKTNPEKVKIAQQAQQIEQLQTRVSRLESQLATLRVQQQAQILQPTNLPYGTPSSSK